MPPRILSHLAALAAIALPFTSHAADLVVWGIEAQSGAAVRAANLDGSGIPSDLVPNEGAPCGVAIDPAAGKIYWTDFAFGGGGVRVANLDGKIATHSGDSRWVSGAAARALVGQMRQRSDAIRRRGIAVRGRDRPRCGSDLLGELQHRRDPRRQPGRHGLTIDLVPGSRRVRA